MSQRNSDDDALLDAARECVMAVGVSRTTFTDVARRAGVSRMTLYRRYPDVTSLLQALMTREFGAVLERVQAETSVPASGERARAQLVRATVLGAELLASHPLLKRIVDVDPELLLPYMTTRLGAFQRSAIELLGAEIERGCREGWAAADDPALTAATVELALRGFVLATRSEGHDATREATLEQLRLMIDRHLRPQAAPS